MCRVRRVGTIQRIRVRKHGHGLVERDPVFSEVGDSLARVPLEHNSVYKTTYNRWDALRLHERLGFRQVVELGIRNLECVNEFQILNS